MGGAFIYYFTVYKGLKIYYNKYKFGCADEKNFFNCMSEACNYDIESFLKEWVYEKSFPILKVTFSEKKDYIIIQQNPSLGKPDIIFKIPIFIKTKNMEKVILMTEKEIEIKLYDLNITYEDIISNNNFIVLNSDIKCFCIVFYYEEKIVDSIISFYNKYKEKNYLNNNENKVSDADIYQILVSNFYLLPKDILKKDIKKLKNVQNSEILLNLELSPSIAIH